MPHCADRERAAWPLCEIIQGFDDPYLAIPFIGGQAKSLSARNASAPFQKSRFSHRGAGVGGTTTQVAQKSGANARFPRAP